jgi:hypothetical protein
MFRVLIRTASYKFMVIFRRPIPVLLSGFFPTFCKSCSYLLLVHHRISPLTPVNLFFYRWFIWQCPQGFMLQSFGNFIFMTHSLQRKWTLFSQLKHWTPALIVRPPADKDRQEAFIGWLRLAQQLVGCRTNRKGETRQHNKSTSVSFNIAFHLCIILQNGLFL